MSEITEGFEYHCGRYEGITDGPVEDLVAFFDQLRQEYPGCELVFDRDYDHVQIMVYLPPGTAIARLAAVVPDPEKYDSCVCMEGTPEELRENMHNDPSKIFVSCTAPGHTDIWHRKWALGELVERAKAAYPAHATITLEEYREIEYWSEMTHERSLQDDRATNVWHRGTFTCDYFLFYGGGGGLRVGPGVWGTPDRPDDQLNAALRILYFPPTTT